MENQRIVCPGCGIELTSENRDLAKDFNASAACRELMFQLSYYTLSLRDEFFVHQLIVDSYAAQHFGPQDKPITMLFALIGLYLVNERNYTGKEVQQAHVALANKSRLYSHFSIPQERDWLTVLDVIQAPDDKKQKMIKDWSRSVWNVWKPEMIKVAALVKKYLDV